jgi:hypothetical protein
MCQAREDVLMTMRDAGYGGSGRSGSGQPDPMASAGGSGAAERSSVGQAADQVQQKAGQVADRVQEAAAPAVEQVQQTAGQVVDQAREQVATRAESQKDRVVDALSMVAQAVRQTGQELRSQDQAGMAGYVDQAARTVERTANFLRARDMGQILDETQWFARRNPALFLGGAFALGLLGARFIKSSAPAPSGSGYGYGYQPSSQYGSYPRPSQTHAPYASSPGYGAQPTYGAQSPYTAQPRYGSQPTQGGQSATRPAASPTYTSPSSGAGRSTGTASEADFELSRMDRSEDRLGGQSAYETLREAEAGTAAQTRSGSSPTGELP